MAFIGVLVAAALFVLPRGAKAEGGSVPLIPRPIEFEPLGKEEKVEGWDRIEDFSIDPASGQIFAVSRSPLSLFVFDDERKFRFRIPLYDKVAYPRSIAVCGGVAWLLSLNGAVRWHVLESLGPEPERLQANLEDAPDRAACAMDGTLALLNRQKGEAAVYSWREEEQENLQYEKSYEIGPLDVSKLHDFYLDPRGKELCLTDEARFQVRCWRRGDEKPRVYGSKELPHEGAISSRLLAARDYDGFLWMYAPADGRLHVFAPNGAYLGATMDLLLDPAAEPEKMAINKKSQLFFLDGMRKQTLVFDLPILDLPAQGAGD